MRLSLEIWIGALLLALAAVATGAGTQGETRPVLSVNGPGQVAGSNLVTIARTTDPVQSCFAAVPAIRRRRAAHPAPFCTDNPTLTITPSRDAAQFGDTVAIAWAASDPGARVCIDGIGSSLPASGTVLVPIFRRLDFHGRASTCNFGPGVTASVNLCQPSTAGIQAASTTVALGASTALSIDASGPWTLSSQIGNGLSKTSGFGSDTVVFTGKVVGLDPLLLVVTSECDNVSRGVTIQVTGVNPEP